MVNNKIGIEWMDRIWNFIIGCDKVSFGCVYCYVEVIIKCFINNFFEGFILKLYFECLK